MLLNRSKYLSSFGSKRNIDSLLLVFIFKLLAIIAEKKGASILSLSMDGKIYALYSGLKTEDLRCT
jgi:hypothetical protein